MTKQELEAQFDGATGLNNDDGGNIHFGMREGARALKPTWIKMYEALEAIDTAYGDSFICSYCESKAGDDHVSQCKVKQALIEAREFLGEKG